MIQSQIVSLNAARTGDIMVPTEASEPGDMELRSQHPDAMVESCNSIEPTPATEIQSGFENVTLENVEHHFPSAAPTSTVGGSLEEQLDKHNDEPIYIVVEMEATTSISRGMSEGIEVASFAGDACDLDGEYVVEEPPTTEASVVSLTSNDLHHLNFACFTGAGGSGR